jgi:parallel beta-helix repeat protein
VRPQGPLSGTFQHAIDKAKSGDRLRIHAGTYSEALTIDKRLQIFAATKGSPPVIDAKCDSSIAVDVTSPGVSIEGLKVKGAKDAFAMNFNNVRSARVRDMRLNNNCGSAEYGFNIFNAGRIRISDSKATGFGDAGVYIGGIGDTSNGALIVRGVTAMDNNRGIIVEDSTGVDIQVKNNILDRNTISGEGVPSGVFVHNSDGVLFEGNKTRSNGVFGIQIDATSDDNVFKNNVSTDNGTDDFFNEGLGNCGSGNSFPLSGC